jgi:hypothetical protein
MYPAKLTSLLGSQNSLSTESEVSVSVMPCFKLKYWDLSPPFSIVFSTSLTASFLTFTWFAHSNTPAGKRAVNEAG